MLTVQHAHSPVYKNEEHTMIDLMVKFEEFQNELPFTASPTDSAEHGVDLFYKAEKGLFGEVAPFVPPPQPKVVGAQDL